MKYILMRKINSVYGAIGRCFVCGSTIYESLGKKNWVEVEEGKAHKECLRRIKAEEKANKLMEVWA